MDGQMNQGNYQQPQTQQMQYQQMQPQQKPKKKKKHGFLKFLLCVAILILLCVGSKAVCNKIAYKQLNEAVLDYPFAFAEQDTMWYVTQDFEVPTYYLNEKGKEVKVTWTSSSRTIVFEDGTANVTRPEKQNITVVVTQTHKWLLGKASIQYELIVVPTVGITVEEVEVVTLEELENQTYNREMKAVLNEDGSLNYMMGDFKSTQVQSIEDAAVVLEAYREQFGANSDVQFTVNKVVDTDIFINYIFDVYYNGYLLEDCNANITVEKATSEMVKIDINADVDLSAFEEVQGDWDYETVIQNYVNENDEVNRNSEMILMNRVEKVVEGKLVVSFNVLFETGDYYNIYIDAKTGEVLEYYTNVISWGEREASTAKGETELGVEVTVDTSKTPMSSEVMYDINREIHTYDNAGWFKWYRDFQKKINNNEDPGTWLSIGAAFDLWISNGDISNYEIKAKKGKIDNAVAVQSQYYIAQTYDWYQQMFGRTSYDGKGAPIVIITDIATSYDNASWVPDEQVFRVNPAKKFQYTLSSSPEVMAHEYTHAVFGSRVVGNTSNAGVEFDGINEAYADIMGCLSTNSQDWIFIKNELTDGSKVCARDIINFNRSNANDGKDLKFYTDITYPETYKEGDWDECHEISVVLSHVAYEMWASDLFTSNEVARIWYNSMGYGYCSDSTYLTVREHVVAAAKALSCNKEQIYFIEKAFSDVGIGEEPIAYITISQAVEGDFILDDTVINRYLVVMSPIGTFLGKSGIYIYQESTGMSKEEVAQATYRLNSLSATKIDGNKLLGGATEVEYRQVNKWAMNIVYDFCADSEAYLEDAIREGMGAEDTADAEVNAIVKFLVKMGIYWETKECTAYDFYDSLGLVE